LSGWGRGGDRSDTGVSGATAAVADVVVAAAAAAAVPEAVVFTVVLAPSASPAASPGASALVMTSPRRGLVLVRASSSA